MTTQNNTPIFGFRPAGEMDFTETQKKLVREWYRDLPEETEDGKDICISYKELATLITQVIQNVGTELVRRQAHVKREIQNKEGVNIDNWSETGKVAYYYVDNSINIIKEVTGVKTN